MIRQKREAADKRNQELASAAKVLTKESEAAHDHLHPDPVLFCGLLLKQLVSR